MQSHLCLWLRQGKPGGDGRVGARLGKVLEGWDRGGEPVKDEMLHEELDLRLGDISIPGDSHSLLLCKTWQR